MVEKSTGRAIAGRILAGLVAFIVPAALVLAYTLDHFYRTGAYFWDSGQFAFLASYSLSWPMPDPPFYHVDPTVPPRTFFHVHIQPIFYFTTALKQAFPAVPPAAFYSLLQAAISGLLGWAVATACTTAHRSPFLALATGLATAFCGPVLATVGYPHIELAIPVLFLVSLVFWLRGRRVSSCVALALCLLVREDAGLHAGSALTALALAQWLAREPSEKIRPTLVAAIVCVAYALAALGFQKILYPVPTGRLFQVYLGVPVGSHVSADLIARRGMLFMVEKGYVVWPLVLILSVAAYKRNAILAAGPLSVLPWVILSLLAAEDVAAFTSFYAFPTLIGIAWPCIAFAMGRAERGLQLCVSVLSIALFVLFGGANHDNKPWRHVTWPDLAAIGGYEEKLLAAIARQDRFGRLMVDNSVASLVPAALKTNEWAFQWAVDSLPNPDMVIYKKNAWDNKETERVVHAAGLDRTCEIAGTPFVIATRVPCDR